MAVALLALQGAAEAEDAKSKVSPEQRAAIEGVVRDYLAAHPEFVMDALKALEAKERAAHAENARKSILSEQDALKRDPSSYVAGNPAGDVTVVEFFDYNCPYCRTVAPTIQALLGDDKKLKVVLKEWPIKGPDSLAVGRVSLAAAKQPKFLAFHFALLAEQDHADEAKALAVAQKAGLDMDRLRSDMKTVDANGVFQRNDALAQKIGINGTPAFVIGQTLIPGAAGADRFKQAIADTRASCKSASC